MWMVCSVTEVIKPDSSTEMGDKWINNPINMDMIATFRRGNDFLFGKMGQPTIEFEDVNQETKIRWFFNDTETRNQEYEMLKNQVMMEARELAQRVSSMVTVEVDPMFR